jgi:hypothetical protein
MATSTFNAQEIETRRQLLREELAALEADKLKNIGGMQVIDYHHPERSPGWPIYRHQEFPKLLYHATEKDPRVEQQRLGLRRRNEANPHLAPMDIPPSEPLTIKVANEQEKAEAEAKGFTATPPSKQSIDARSPLEVIGQGASNPLLADVPQPLSVETIIKLNALPKDELLAQARDVYGLTVDDEDSKITIITAIQAKGERQ